MSYAAILEIVGIKELAEDDYEKFSLVTTNFKLKAIQSVMPLIDKSRKLSLSIFLFKDHCYIQANDLNALINYIFSLRKSFFEVSHYFFRCALTVGDLSLNESKIERKKSQETQSTAEIKYFEYSEVSTKLYAMLERFKGIGIMLDLESLVKENAFKSVKYSYFTNYFITDIANKKYQPYYDVAIRGDDFIYEALPQLFKRMGKDKLLSKKVARFYIPLLVNIARSFDLTTSKNEERSLPNIIGTPAVTKHKDVPGFDFFFYMLIDNLFDVERNKKLRDTGYDEELNNIEKKLAKNSWLLESLRNDSRFFDIPKEILNNSRRRIALRKISDILHQE